MRKLKDVITNSKEKSGTTNLYSVKKHLNQFVKTNLFIKQ